MSLSFLDTSVILFYFLVIFAISFYVQRGQSQAEDYFLAGRNLGWFAAGASIFASNIGSEHLIGLAGSGASSGVAVAQFEILACFALMLLGWLFAPFYLRTAVVTMPEFLEKRYSKQARNYLTFISVLAYVLTKISVTIYAGAVVFETIGVPFWIGAFIVVLSTGIYTVMGGLKAVIYTDLIQLFVMVAGAILITYFGLETIGGWENVRANIPMEHLNMWKGIDHPEFPWTGIILGAPILGVWYWCTDQFVVQRILAAKNLSEARKSTLFAGYLKLLPLFIFVIPGIIAYALSQTGQISLIKNDQALPILASAVLPVGAKGLFVAGLLAALMSSLSSVFNSCSTLITYEFYKPRYPEAGQKALIRFGRISTVFLVLCGLAWIPLMKLISSQLFTYIQSVQAYIAPPIAAVFLLGVTWRKINAKGAIAALYSGFVLGISRLMMEMFSEKLPTFLKAYAEMNFLHFAFFLFVLSIFIAFFTSQVSGGPKKDISSLTIGSEAIVKDRSYRIDQLLTLGLFISVLIIWKVFS